MSRFPRALVLSLLLFAGALLFMQSLMVGGVERLGYRLVAFVLCFLFFWVVEDPGE